MPSDALNYASPTSRRQMSRKSSVKCVSWLMDKYSTWAPSHYNWKKVGRREVDAGSLEPM